jgi:hypothetical protein
VSLELDSLQGLQDGRQVFLLQPRLNYSPVLSHLHRDVLQGLLSGLNLAHQRFFVDILLEGFLDFAQDSRLLGEQLFALLSLVGFVRQLSELLFLGEDLLLKLVGILLGDVGLISKVGYNFIVLFL